MQRSWVLTIPSPKAFELHPHLLSPSLMQQRQQLSKWQEQSKAHGGHFPHLLPCQLDMGTLPVWPHCQLRGPRSLPYHPLQPQRS